MSPLPFHSGHAYLDSREVIEDLEWRDLATLMSSGKFVVFRKEGVDGGTLYLSHSFQRVTEYI